MRYRGYSANDGRHVADHVRLDLPDGKRVWWEQPDGTKGLDGFPLADLALYRAAEMPMDGPIVMVEGEKACDALRARGIASVGTMTGAAIVPSEAALRPLLGRDVILWPDNDNGGRRHMEGLGQRLIAMEAAR